MANPKRRHSRSRRDKRRANWKLEEVNYTTCTQCSAVTLQHTACSKCGFYGDKIAVTIKTKNAKKESQEKTQQEVASSEQK